MHSLNNPSAVAIVVAVVALSIVALLLAGQAATIPVLIGLGMAAINCLSGPRNKDDKGDGSAPR